MNKKLKELKEIIKDNAIRIRELKCEIKTLSRENKSISWSVYGELHRKKIEVRHMLIAYGELRGIDRGRIEKTCKNPPEEYLIDAYKIKYSEVEVENA